MTKAKTSNLTRSEIMRAVKSKDTAPEIVVRKLTHSLGFRYRLHRADLPGKPDLVFPTRRKVVFVHGCFWHGHICKRGARPPRQNAAYWSAKIARNVDRDARNQIELHNSGWDVFIVWECETKAGDRATLATRLDKFLTRPG
ncbi:very short patch repair endonuclease [Mesorhizobium sp. ESP7-2]|uniref:very short patch repair endonuclease n=1 Tax=Mesorhizobium sp. ESP7-2 TaxID=2876622 RepID=UPI001CCFD3B3|nr:very short patch repair endonuclease [Mesorhizobium sp. ESP7-2]MBZ9711475.1 very short patch repair endonuclease [Mesorhizobium sp. ESP7-2]